MKIIDNTELNQMHYEEVKTLTLSGEQFVVCIEQLAGERVSKFLKNEANFRKSSRTLTDRLRYIFIGLSAYPSPEFGLLWNRACMDGYHVTEIRSIEEKFEIYFSK